MGDKVLYLLFKIQHKALKIIKYYIEYVLSNTATFT